MRGCSELFQEIVKMCFLRGVESVVKRGRKVVFVVAPEGNFRDDRARKRYLSLTGKHKTECTNKNANA